jgi:hypothetical protein
MRTEARERVTTRRRMRGLALGLMLPALLATAAPAQFPETERVLLCIYQDGVQVGEVYNDRLPEQTTYVEHWVLYDTYLALGPEGRRSAQVEVCEQRYTSVPDFLANVQFGAGYRYIHVTAHEADELPRVSAGRSGGRRGR